MTSCSWWLVRTNAEETRADTTRGSRSATRLVRTSRCMLLLYRCCLWRMSVPHHLTTALVCLPFPSSTSPLMNWLCFFFVFFNFVKQSLSLIMLSSSPPSNQSGLHFVASHFRFFPAGRWLDGEWGKWEQTPSRKSTSFTLPSHFSLFKWVVGSLWM